MKYKDRENIMNIVIYIYIYIYIYMAQKKKEISSVKWFDPTNVWSELQRQIRSECLGFQIKDKYKKRVDQGAKRYEVQVLLI